MKGTKLLISFLSFLISISPLLYGLHVYNWDIQEFLAPKYLPPEIAFKTELSSYGLSKDKIFIILNITNDGELEIRIMGINASLYSGSTWISDVLLDKPVDIPPNSTVQLKMYLN